jgi:hypothetical protein
VSYIPGCRAGSSIQLPQPPSVSGPAPNNTPPREVEWAGAQAGTWAPCVSGTNGQGAGGSKSGDSMNRLKLAQPAGIKQRPAVLIINQREPFTRRTPSALKAWALSNGYTLAGKRQARA